MATIKSVDFTTGWREIETVIQKLSHALEEYQQPSRLPGSEESEKQPQQYFITKLEYINTYTYIHDMCLDKEHNNSGQLYEAYKKQLMQFVRNKIYTPIKGLKGEDLLKAISNKWGMYKTFLDKVSHLFAYLENSYIEHNNLSKLKSLGYQIYMKQVHENLKDMIISAFQDEVQKDRDNYKTDLQLLRKVSEIFAEINKNESKDPNDTYLQLGKALTEHARDFYTMLFSQWSESLSSEDYVNHALEIHAGETKRFEKCLSKFTDTYKDISDIFFEEMVRKYKPILLSKDQGFLYMLENKKLDVLANVYLMFSQLKDNFEGLRQAFCEWVTKNGNSIFNEKIKQILDETPEQKKKKKFATDNDFIERIFEEYRTVNQIITVTLQNDPHFQMSFKSALNSFLNVTIEDYGLPELLANYTDFTLKKSNLSHEELDQKLEQVIEIFNHLSEKDIYLILYQQQLAQRLLGSDSVGGSKYDDESIMITKIKGCCGQGQETKNFEGMINDIKLTVDIKRGFAEHVAKNNIKIADVYVKVLQEANWPAYKGIDINLPIMTQTVKEEFKAFYSSTKRNQKLRWIDTLGNFEIKLNISPEKNYLVTVSPIQLSILQQFEKSDEWIPSSSLLDNVGLKSDNFPDFHREMVQLVVKRILISSKLKTEESKANNNNGNTTITADEEHFRFNTEFQYKTKKFATLADSAVQKFKRDIVNENREHAVEAAIVRVIKSRKTMPFNELVSEVHSLMRKFQTSLQQIKRRIESLVEREYIERDKNDLNLYHYKS